MVAEPKSVSMLSTLKGCVLVPSRNENDSRKGHDSAYTKISYERDLVWSSILINWIMNYQVCQYCKHCICSVTYDLKSGQPISHKYTCRITHKEKKDNDVCKRFRYKQAIVAA